MEKFFGPDSLLSKMIAVLANTIVLSLLWIAGCIPVATIGTSTTAAYYAAFRALDGDKSILRNYLKSFKVNFRQSLVLEGIVVLPLLILLGGIAIVYAMGSLIPGGIAAGYGVIAFAFFAVLSYLFPILSYFHLPTGTIVKNAALIALANGGWTFVVVFVNLLPLLLPALRMDWALMILPLLITLVPGGVVEVNALIFKKIFPQYACGKDNVPE